MARAGAATCSRENNCLAIRGIAMTIRRMLQFLALTVIALSVGAAAGRAQTQQHAWPKLSAKSWMKLQQNPQAWNAFVARLPLVPANPEPTPAPLPDPGSW